MEQHTSLRFGRTLVVVLADVLILAEVFYAMYMASKTPDEITPVFMKAFLPLALPTVLVAILVSRYLRKREAASAEAPEEAAGQVQP